MNRIALIVPFMLGLRDGWNEPFDLSSGLTWDSDQDKNETYDRGVNVGQNLRRACSDLYNALAMRQPYEP